MILLFMVLGGLPAKMLYRAWRGQRLKQGAIPTIGANGFIVRRELIDEIGIGEYMFDVDMVAAMVRRGHDRFAKVKISIVHLYGNGLRVFARKQLRRIRDFSFYSSLGMRSYPWSGCLNMGVLRFIVSCLLLLPLVYQATKGYRRVPDSAWLLHVPACYVTLAVYTVGFLEGKVRPREQERFRWTQ